MKHDKYLRDRELDYDPLAPWPLERDRFATIDVQASGGRHYYLVIRAWGLGGVSRQLYHEKIGPGTESYANLLATCQTRRVPDTTSPSMSAPSRANSSPRSWKAAPCPMATTP